eukprot:1087549-Ditylum_brightwellii.AAC.1
MMRQPCSNNFKAVIYKEVKHVFDNQVWEKLPRTKMLEYYRNLQMQGIDMKRKQLVLIWSFKRKRYTDGSLSKHKTSFYCHGGQQQWV